MASHRIPSPRKLPPASTVNPVLSILRSSYNSAEPLQVVMVSSQILHPAPRPIPAVVQEPVVIQEQVLPPQGQVVAAPVVHPVQEPVSPSIELVNQASQNLVPQPEPELVPQIPPAVVTPEVQILDVNINHPEVVQAEQTLVQEGNELPRDLETMKKSDLQALATTRGVSVSPTANRNELIAALRGSVA